MAILPDLQSLHDAATSVERTAVTVDTDAHGVAARLESIPWTGPRRDRLLEVAEVTVGTARRQAEAERALARALRELAGAVERELRELAALAARARRHLEELLTRARAAAAGAAQDLATAAAAAASFVFDLATGDPAGAVRAAERLIQLAEDRLRLITVRLHGLPEPLEVAVGGSGQVGLTGFGGTGGAASVRFAIERTPAGAITKLTLVKATEVDRGRHGLAPIEALNREATLEEEEWKLELTPELRARADQVASALAGGRPPRMGDLGVLADAVTGVESTVRTYDVRHQAVSADVAIPDVAFGVSGGVDTARLREPPPAAPPDEHQQHTGDA